MLYTLASPSPGAGVPLGLVIAGANRHDCKLFEATVDSVVVNRPKPTRQKPQGWCLDKGYDYPFVRELATAFGSALHLRTRGEESRARQETPRYRARRWVVERTHSWLNRFRRLLIRWEKKAENYLGFLHFACALISYRAAGVFG